ncbi:MAG: elongation factor G [Clostridia bacterium]|nr:elongation factor G [Clostridia bacterium]
MNKFTTKTIRNVALLGHSGDGKTSIAEAMLHVAGCSDRFGKVTEGNTVCDFDPEEIKRGYSLSTTIAPLVWNDVKINIIDTPGYLDFVGEVKEAVRVADSAIIAVNAKAGVEVGTDLAWDYATEAGIPKAFFINKFDDPEASFTRVFDQLKEEYGVSICPIVIPQTIDGKIKGFVNLINMKGIWYTDDGGAEYRDIDPAFMDSANEYRNMLLESIAQTDDVLLDKFFNEEEITYEEAVNAIHEGIIHGDIVPVFAGSATRLWGIRRMLDTIVDSFPRFTARKVEKSVEGDDVEINPEGDTSIFVFKTVADPFVGKMSYFKVMSGTLKRDMTLKNLTSEASEKLAKIYTIRGKKQTEVDELACGDIGMIAKLTATNTNDTLTASGSIKYAPVNVPEPFYTMAIKPAAKGDEDKISSGITKLLEEDLTIKYENNAETKQLLISGLGDIHLDVVSAKLKQRFGTSVTLEAPIIPYRETIKKKVQAEGKHKKQSGGHGQYGHVRIEFGPGEGDGLTFTESVVGGAVPKGFFPAVEKGLLEAMAHGVLAGYPVVGLAANLYDGSYHDVDSSEMAFKLAASLAYKDGLAKANPVILEPVGELNVLIPDNMMGDVLGDINKRRGRVLSMEASHDKKGYQIVTAEVPKSEMADYTIALRALSQGYGSFTFYFVRYEEAPANVAQKIIDEAKKAEA